MLSIDVKDLDPREVYYYLVGGVAPRPIAFVSTISKDGKHNLAPFSFFNAFGANPPMIGFSPAKRGSDGTFKDTYNNLTETKECVVQVVNSSIVEQVSLSSCEYAPGVDEFVKSGLTAIDSDIVKAKRVKESPFQMEAKLHQMVNLGEGGGAGNLAICEVLKFHISKDILKDGRIDPYLIDLVGRNGGNFYTHAQGDALFEIKKPTRVLGMGFDALPDALKSSDIYSANNLAAFAHSESAPTEDELGKFVAMIEDAMKRNGTLEVSEEAFKRYEERKDYVEMLSVVLSLQNDGYEDKHKLKQFVEKAAKVSLEANDIAFAWKTAMLVDYLKLG